MSVTGGIGGGGRRKATPRTQRRVQRALNRRTQVTRQPKRASRPRGGGAPQRRQGLAEDSPGLFQAGNNLKREVNQAARRARANREAQGKRSGGSGKRALRSRYDRLGNVGPWLRYSVRAKKVLDAGMRQMPDRGERQGNRVLRAWKPERSGRPKVEVDRDHRGGAYVKSGGRNTIYVSPDIYLRGGRRSANPRSPRDAGEFSTLLHELAHTRQADRLWRASVEDIEGGAEAFEQIVAPRVGLRSVTNRKYAPYARKARRRGRRYVKREQFR